MRSLPLLMLAVCYGCTTIDLSTIQGVGTAVPYTEESFRSGDYRFSKTAGLMFRSFGGKKIDWQMRLKNYDQALERLIDADAGNDVHYWYLAEIAESKGYFVAAVEYYEVARILTDEASPAVSNCTVAIANLMESNFSRQMLHRQAEPCFLLNFKSVIDSGIARVREKQLGEYETNVIEYDDGSLYVGEVRDGVASGYGEITYETGDFYHGNFSGGKPQGIGTLVFQERNLAFHGEFSGGLPEQGNLHNPRLNWGLPMVWKGTNFAYYNGDPFGSRPADNGYFLSANYGEVLARAIDYTLTNHIEGSLAPAFMSRKTISNSCSMGWGKLTKGDGKPRCED